MRTRRHCASGLAPYKRELSGHFAGGTIAPARALSGPVRSRRLIDQDANTTSRPSGSLRSLRHQRRLHRSAGERQVAAPRRPHRPPAKTPPTARGAPSTAAPPSARRPTARSARTPRRARRRGWLRRAAARPGASRGARRGPRPARRRRAHPRCCSRPTTSEARSAQGKRPINVVRAPVFFGSQRRSLRDRRSCSAGARQTADRLLNRPPRSRTNTAKCGGSLLRYCLLPLLSARGAFSSEGGSITETCGDLGQPRAREPRDAGSTTFCGVHTWQVKVNLLATFATPKDSTHE